MCTGRQRTKKKQKKKKKQIGKKGGGSTSGGPREYDYRKEELKRKTEENGKCKKPGNIVNGPR